MHPLKYDDDLGVRLFCHRKVNSERGFEKGVHVVAGVLGKEKQSAALAMCPISPAGPTGAIRYRVLMV
jgi:hypothetical protein